jgi:hypothetical protein
MKFSPRTITILKNFVTINQSLAFKQGNVLTTISPSKSVLAKATIAETIESDFCIYDLSKFISTLSLFNEPEFMIEQTNGVISEGKRKVVYGFAVEEMIVTPPKKPITLPQQEASFELTNDVFGSTLKASSILSLSNSVPTIKFTGDGNLITVSAYDAKGAISDVYSVEIGNTDQTFNAVFKVDNLKLLPDDYQVTINGKAAKFTSKDIEYIVAVES